MWNETAFTRRVGVEYPIVQGPFGGGLSSTRLAATVSNAGGLGSFAMHHLSPAQIKEVAAEIRSLTAKPFALNLWIAPPGEPPTLSRADFERNLARLDPYYRELGIERPAFPNRFGQVYDEQVEAILEVAPPVLSFVFGIPSARVLGECRRRGIITMGTATTVDEAVTLEEAGIDVIVATGCEAGGHRVAFLKSPEEGLIGSLALIPQVVDRVKAPVVAAGGIAESRGVVAALALGAHGVQIGTAFLACEESAASAPHREQIFSVAATDTWLTKAFTERNPSKRADPR